MKQKTTEADSVIMAVEGVLLPTCFSKQCLILRGILAIIIGVLLVIAPVASAAGFIMGIGALLVIDGVFLLVMAFKAGDRAKRAGIVYGILTIILGLILLAKPLLTGVILLIMVGIWQLITGINQLTEDYGPIHAGWIRFSGVLAILTGIMFIIWPFLSLTVFTWVTGIMLIVSGGTSLVTAFFRNKAPSKAPSKGSKKVSN